MARVHEGHGLILAPLVKPTAIVGPGIRGPHLDVHMTSPSLSEVQATVWEVVRRINAAWVHSRTDDLRELLHPSMVIVPPGGLGPVRGQAACIASYRDFTVRAKVLRFEELMPAVDVFGDTAVVTYAFEIFYELEGIWTTAGGSEIFVLTREDGRWWAVWRTQLPPAS